MASVGLTSVQFDALRNHAAPREQTRALLVRYTSSWCTPCRAAVAVVSAFCRARGDGAPDVLDVDIDRCPHDVGVSQVPTFHLFNPGAPGHVAHVGLPGLDMWLRDHCD